MYKKRRTKQEQMFIYRAEVSRLVRNLVCTRTVNGVLENGYSLTELASILHLTIAQMSRVYHGVCTLSGPAFLELRSVYENRFGVSWLQ